MFSFQRNNKSSNFKNAQNVTSEIKELDDAY